MKKNNNRLYYLYYGMKERCYNPKHPSYKYYSEKGITICDEWLNDFDAFAEWALNNGYDYSKNRKEQSIDRIDNNKGYSPDNCRFITHKENCQNNSRNKWLEFNGKRLNLSDWSKELNIPIETIRARLRKGLSTEEILSTEKFKPGVKKKAVIQ